jgi:phenylacetate-CoA ligase
MHSRLSNKVQAPNFRGRVMLPLVYACIRDPRFKMMDELLARDEWSHDQIKAHQVRRLERLLQVGWEHNPYWRGKFERYGVNYRGADPYAELAKLPILTKDEVRANYEQMHSTHLPRQQSTKVTSSGSTSKQVTVWHSQYYKYLHIATDYRSLARMGVRPGDPSLSVVGHTAHFPWQKLLLRRFRTLLDGAVVMDAFRVDTERARRSLCRAHRHGCMHIRGYPTAMVGVAHLSQEMGLKWTTVKAVSTTAEPLLDKDRKLLESVYGAKVYDKYGSSEVLSIAMECNEGNHHIYADLNYVEFVQVEDADEGYEAIVVTPLDNEAMPLFRYRNGDSASAVKGTCSCGLASPLMTACTGRICNNFVTPDGRIVHGFYLLWFFVNHEGYRAYQFHQTTPEHIDLYVAPEGQLTAERRQYLYSICERVPRDIHSGLRVDLHIVNEIPRTPTGKHMYILSDCLSNL